MLSVLKVVLAGVAFIVSCLLVTFSSHRALAPNCPAMGQCLPCSLKLSLHFYHFWFLLSPQYLFQAVFDLAPLSDSYSSIVFIYMQCGPLCLGSQSQNETQGTGKVLPFPTSIIPSLLGGLLPAEVCLQTEPQAPSTHSFTYNKDGVVFFFFWACVVAPHLTSVFWCFLRHSCS